MSKEYLIIDPHGGHNNCHPGVDDGVASPAEMVKAAKLKGIIPSITSHNGMRGVKQYLEAMENVGWKKMALPGVEFSFRVVAVDLDGDDNYPPKPELLIWTSPERAVYTQDHEGLPPCRQPICSNDIWYTRQHLLKLFSEENIPLLNSMTAIPKADWKSYLFPRAFEKKFEHQIAMAERLLITKFDPGFVAFYSKLHCYEKEQGIELTAEEELTRVTMLVDHYAYIRDCLERKGLNKGEIICLMPQDKSLVDKMSVITDEWREEGHYKTNSLTGLFSFVGERLTEGESSDLIWHVPHPVSIDATHFGKLITRLMEGKIKLFSPEIFLPEIAQKIDTIEVLNAAHPGETNCIAEKISEIDLLKDKGKVGASDSHHPYWVGSGATLIAVEEKTTDGILIALKEGKTVPLSGWGTLSHTWVPFFAWLATRTIGGKFYDLPGAPFRRMSQMLDVQTPAKKAIEEGLIEGHKQNGWIE